MRGSLFLLLSMAVAGAQSSPAPGSDVRVCVGTPSNVSHLAVSPVVERDRLIDEINTRDGLRGKVKVTALPVPGGSQVDISEAARAEDCRLLVSMRFEESFGYPPRNPDPVSHQPRITEGGTHVTRRTTLAYSIARVDGRGSFDEGRLPLPAGGSDVDAVFSLIRVLSPRVVHDAVKSKP